LKSIPGLTKRLQIRALLSLDLCCSPDNITLLDTSGKWEGSRGREIKEKKGEGDRGRGKRFRGGEGKRCRNRGRGKTDGKGEEQARGKEGIG
jgi:hypothetical protein